MTVSPEILAAIDSCEAAPRRESEFTIADPINGRATFRIYDRISIDDVVLHMTRRELFRRAGGRDPGDDIPRDVKDFLLLEYYIQR